MKRNRSRIRLLTLAAIISSIAVITASSATDSIRSIVLAPGIGESLSRSRSLPARDPDASFVGAPRDPDLCQGWPVDLDPPGAGFPYTPMLYDADGDGALEIFLTGGHTFALKGDGTFLPGWPVREMRQMGYGTNDSKPPPSGADMEADGDREIMWSERDWWAGNSYMWCFDGKNLDGTNMPGFPQEAPDDLSNALDVPFVLGDTDGDGDLEAWGPHTLGNTFVHYRVSGFDHSGARLFTTDLDSTENILCLYFGDVDGDAAKEMFAVSLLSPSFMLHVFDAGGGEAPGYPIALATGLSGWNMFGPPLPADLDGDGDLEIILGHWDSSASYAECYHHNGEQYGSFPILIATDSQLLYMALGDVNGDSIPELVALENDLPGDYRVFAIDIVSEEVLPGWPFNVVGWPEGFPAIADVDGDGRQDVCFVTDGGELYAVSSDGLLIDGYPKQMASPAVSGVAAGDIDGDGLFELVAATWDGWVYAWDTPSQALAGRADWPMRGVNARNTGVYGDVLPEEPPVLVRPDEEPGGQPRAFGLSQNFPNPFNPATTIVFEVPEGEGAERRVTLTIFDARGRHVKTLVDGELQAGRHELVWDGRNVRGAEVSSGIYFATLRSGGTSSMRKMLLGK